VWWRLRLVILCLGNPQDVLRAISERHKLEPVGEPSLQNAIEMARSSMRFVASSYAFYTDGCIILRCYDMATSHLPTHSSREILVISGSLTTVDPGNIYETLASCVKDRIRISLVALAAEMKICRELCDKTGGAPSPPPSVQSAPPPPTRCANMSFFLRTVQARSASPWTKDTSKTSSSSSSPHRPRSKTPPERRRAA